VSGSGLGWSGDTERLKNRMRLKNRIMFLVFPVLFPVCSRLEGPKTKAVPSVPSSWAQAHISGPRSCIQILKLMGTPGTLGTSFGLNRLQCSHSFPEVGTLGTAKECEPIVHNIETTDDNESFYSVDCYRWIAYLKGIWWINTSDLRYRIRGFVQCRQLKQDSRRRVPGSLGM
jgi:hypothetical protein